jgi:3-oxoacyl-[acyl-carrier-protein] synthase-3
VLENHTTLIWSPDTRYIKMHGVKFTEFALTTVPAAMKAAWTKAGIAIDDVKRFLFRKQMKKMDEAIIQRFTDFMSVQFPQDLSMHQ